MRRPLVTGAALVLAALALPAPVLAQQGGQSAAAQGLEQMPPALRAAVLSGNAQAIQQALATLSAGNPGRLATLAGQVIAAAERMLATNPAAAVQIAGAAVNSFQSAAIQQAAPQQAMQVMTIAARIFISPAAQAAAPILVAQYAQTVVQIASTPAVYQASPQGAMAVMANAYQAVSSPAVAAAVPSAAAAVSQAVTAAAQSPALNAINPAISAQATQILATEQSAQLAVPVSTPVPAASPVVIYASPS